MQTNSTPVLIVGGSLVGLSAAMFLAARGVSSILVERHTGSSPHPRAIGYTPRTLELFRALDLNSQIPQVPADFRLRRAQVESLAGKWMEDTPWTPEKAAQPKTPPTEYSPCIGAAIAQDKLEPILRNKAVELGADLRLGTELVSFEQDDKKVTALVRERDGGRVYTIEAGYMIAADGNLSPVREKLGIKRRGLGHLRTIRSVLFRAPLDEYLKSGIFQFEIDQPNLKAFLTTYFDGRWVLMFTDEVERNESALRSLIFQAIGRTDLEVEIIATGCWELSAMIADSFSSGRIFIAGDAAHTLPPTRGGFGANTGIQDAHNLAWKLSAVLSGASTPQLLDTYNDERQPIAWTRYQQTFARPDYADYATEDLRNLPIIDDAAMEFGQLYKSAAVIGAGKELPEALRPDEWAGQPGTRAPHLWVSKGVEKLSTLDFLQRGWVLFAEDEPWVNAAAQASERLNIGLECVRVGIDFQPTDAEVFRTAFGLGTTGASLIRPDGYVAWRSKELPADDAPTALTAALGRASSAARRVVETKPPRHNVINRLQMPDEVGALFNGADRK